ncbi:MAG: dockerin type I repeat-containing protein, partial [Ruminiclostridium sp.]
MKKVINYCISKVSKQRLTNLGILFLVLFIVLISGKTFAATATVNYADVNGDGSIDALDSALFRMYILNTIDTFPVEDGDEIADLDGDGAVNAIDFSLLKQYLLGRITQFPVESQSNVNIPWDWAGVIGTGQSLSVGAQANPAVTTSQPYHNLKLSLGNITVPPFEPSNSALRMVPLVEPIHSYASGYPSPYPKNIYGETPHTVMGNQITSMVQNVSGKDYITAHTVVGESGQGMVAIRKGATDTGSVGRAYAASMFEVNAIKRLAAASGKTYGVGAIILTHGETDSGSSTYKNDIYKLWSD